MNPFTKFVVEVDVYLPMLYAKYKAHRERYGCNAQQAYRWAKAKPQPKWITQLPYTDKATRVLVPGLGHVCFELKDDTDHDPWDGDGQGFEWYNTDNRNDCNDKRASYCGAKLDDNMYSLDHWDHRSVYVVRFDKKSGSRLEDRYAYMHARGMSKDDAWLHANQSIKDECAYWKKVATNEISWVGGIVTLYDSDEDDGNLDEIGSESCWGFQYPDDDDYLLGEMNNWATSLVAKHWQLKHECEAPLPGDKSVDDAWRSWQTAMVTSDGDREIADPIFVSTYKEKLNVERFLSGRLVQNRRGRSVLRSGSKAAGQDNGSVNGGS